MFLAGLAYLQFYQIANINWNRLETVAEDTITTISNAITQIPGISSNSDVHAATASLAMTSLSIPLTSSISAGFTIGFMKGWLYDSQKSKWCCWSFNYDRSVKKTEDKKESGSLKSRMYNIV